MQARRGFGWTGALLALGWLAAIAGCLVAGSDGDPNAGFVAGAAGSTGTGYAGSTSTGAAGTSGAAGAGGASQACTTGATGAFQIAWTVEDATGAPSTCAAVGGETVDVLVRNVDTGGQSTNSFSCAGMSVTTCALPPGTYALSMKLRGPTGTLLSEIVAPVLALGGGQPTDLGSLPFRMSGAGGDAGAGANTGLGFALTWSIAAADTGAPLTCTEASAKTVRLKVGPQMFDLPCAPGLGRTTTVAPGSYPVSVILLDAQGTELSVTQTMTITVGAGQLVFLGDVVFDVI